ncbi:sulfonate transport system substrate-binding protein [Sphingobium sp. B1D7B]|uniref:ABC transporter substrate-binding protein n=1 Tax=Sphingobium sp. B1D7B TaxID=2940578 RepID=UPI002224B133|nr:ABC transporter substrate-binding protein [Sphingobium sp. B1D7B]MCW2404623.1 sulfonate transport system substrate-binding protein [Sphingobium sp. B1D7B]
MVDQYRKSFLSIVRRGLLGITAMLGCAVVAACGGSGSGGDAGPVKTVTIASIAYPYQGKQVFNGLNGIVLEQGWLKEQLAKKGIDLVFAPVSTAVGGPLINEGFSGKRIDFASYGDFPAVIAVSGGVPLKIVAPVGQGQDVYLIVRKGLAARRVEDLKGKRIALHRGRPWELPFSKLVDSKGLKLTDFKIVNINPSATPAALESGSVDAAVLLSDGLLVEQKGIGRVIWSTKEAPADWKMRAELFARKDFVDAHPDLTQLVVDAFVRAAVWSSDEANRDGVIQRSSRGALPPEIVAKDYANSGIPWRERFSPLFSPALRTHYHSVADYALERGLIRNKVDADALLDERFVQQAIKDQKLEGFWAQPAPAVN